LSILDEDNFKIRSGNIFTALGRTRSNFMPFLTTCTTNFYHCINISNFEEEQNLAIFQTMVEIQPSLAFCDSTSNRWLV
jgi:hypothetical protein